MEIFNLSILIEELLFCFGKLIRDLRELSCFVENTYLVSRLILEKNSMEEMREIRNNRVITTLCLNYILTTFFLIIQYSQVYAFEGKLFSVIALKVNTL